MSDRPRDRLGRPLGEDSDRSLAVPGIPVRDWISDDGAWGEAIAYLDAGLPFHAHETFETRWRVAPPTERQAWKALAQWAAALTHQARGNPRGAATLARRAIDTLDGAQVVAEVVDQDRVRSSCSELAALFRADR